MVILQKTWSEGNEKIGWDDALPENLKEEIIKLFIEVFDLEKLEILRSIWPNEETEGKPNLIMFSDGSVLVYGAVVYIRWKLKTGKWWTMLVMSKRKIGPRNRRTWSKNER